MAYPLITEKQTFFYQHANGNWVPASGYKLFVYLAGTTTKATIHKETDESSQNTNPIVLNSRGEVPNGLYVAGGAQYKLVLAPSTDTDPPSAAVWTRDELTPINDTTVTVSQWQASGYTPTYVSGTSFTVTGDRTSTFQVGQRVKTTNTGGTIYGRVSASAYTSLTTVTLVNDSGSLDAGLSAVEVALLSANNHSTPLLVDTYPVVSGSSDKTKLVRIEADTNVPTGTTVVLTSPASSGVISVVTDTPGYLYGCAIANNAGDATNDIDFGSGVCMDSTNTYVLTASAMTKRLDAVWSAGTTNGGLDTGSIANDTYHCFRIRKDSDGTVDALFSTSPTAPTMPSGYTTFRRVGSIIRSGGAIVAFSQRGDQFLRMVPVLDVDVVNLSTTAVSYTLSVPTDIKVDAMIVATTSIGAGVSYVLLTSPDQTDTAASSSLYSLTGSTSFSGSYTHPIRTNTSAQIRARSNAASTIFQVITNGWIDTRQ